MHTGLRSRCETGIHDLRVDVSTCMLQMLGASAMPAVVSKLREINVWIINHTSSLAHRTSTGARRDDDSTATIAMPLSSVTLLKTDAEDTGGGVQLKLDDTDVANVGHARPDAEALFRPRPPYRAWGFPSCSPSSPASGGKSHACPLLEDFSSFRGTNLFLTANGNAVNESAALNANGVAVLAWATGPDNPDAKNCSGYFTNYTNPTVTHCPPAGVNHRSKPAASCHGNDGNLLNYTWAGVAIDEWNPDPCPCAFCDQYAIAAAGWREARKRWPTNFVALWASHEGLTPDSQTVLAGIVADGTIDLLIFEAYTYNWEGSGALDEAAIDRRLAFAKHHGIIHKTIPCFGFVLSTNPKNRSEVGMTITQIHSLVTRFKAKYPEMPGVAFSSEGLAWNDTGSLALVQQATALAVKLYPDPPRKTDDVVAQTTTDNVSQPLLLLMATAELNHTWGLSQGMSYA